MISVVISANTEWDSLITNYSGIQFENSPFGKYFRINFEGEELVFFYGGWGKIEAAASTQFIIDSFHPELIINIGTCGGFETLVDVEEIILVDKTIVYDINERMFDPDQAIQSYTTQIDISWVKDIPEKPIRRSLLVSADRDIDPQEIKTLRSKYNAVVADWESGAIAHICKKNEIPVLIARGVSDIVGIHGGDSYQNPKLFISKTKNIMQRLIDFLPAWISMFRSKN